MHSPTTIPVITNYDLFTKKYTMQEIIHNLNIGLLDLKCIINRHPVTASFCDQYIFGSDAGLTKEEDYYLNDISYIVARQPHLTHMLDHNKKKS
jgi:hypothetical protein